MAQAVGSLKVDLTLDSAAFAKGLDASQKQLAVTQSKFTALGGKFTEVGKNLSIGLTAPLAAFAAKGISEAQATAAAMGQVNAALASMGPLAGRSSAQLSAAANAFEGASLFEADEILKKVTANMLTFGNVAGSNFDRAQQAAIDLATRMGGDLQGATLLVGKALNDPVKGMAALGRAGVQLTDGQKEAIKAMVATGDAAGAQKIILGELEKQFGGAAKAAQETDPWNKVKDAFNNVAETVGNALIPILPVVASAIETVANAFTSLSPETQKFIIIAAGSAAALGPMLAALGSLTTVLGNVLPLVTKLGPVWTVLKGAMMAARVAALTTLPALTPFLVPLGAIAVAVGAVYLAWKNWDKIKAVVQGLYSSVKTWLMDKLGAVIDWVKVKVESLAAPFKWLDNVVVRNSYIPDMVTSVGLWMAKLPKLMGDPTETAVARANASFASIGEGLPSALSSPTMAPIAAIEGSAPASGQSAPTGLLPGLQRVRAAWEEVGVAGDTAIGSMAAGILDKLTPAIEALQSRTATLGEKIGAVGDLFGDLIGKVFGGKAGRLFGAVLGNGLKIANAIDPARFGGARANGGPVAANRMYLVGEQGPEIFTPRARGSILPNDMIKEGNSRPTRIQVVPSKYFDVIVDGRAAAVAAPMAGRAAMAGATGGVAGVQRTAARRIP